MGDPTTERIENALAAYRDGGVEAMLEYVHPEFSMTTTPDIASEPDTYEGHDGLRRYFGSFFEAMDEVRIEPTEIEARGDRLLMAFDLVARGKASGIETSQPGNTIWELRDGLVTSVTFFAERGTAEEAFGAG